VGAVELLVVFCNQIVLVELYILLGDFIALSVSKIGGYQFQI
jgi:hypothetical protein